MNSTEMPSSASAATRRWISALAPTSMPRVGSSSSSSLGAVSSQRASSTFCWFPPDSVADDRLGIGGADVEGLHVAVGELGLLASRDRSRPAASRLHRQDDVGADAEVADQAFGAPVLGGVGDAVGEGDAWVAQPYRLTIDRHLAAVGAVGAEQQAGGLGASRSEQAGHADHLTDAHLEVERGDARLAAEPGGLQERRGRAASAVSCTSVFEGVEHGELAADHLRHELEPGELGREVLADQAAVAQHGDAIGDAIHLIEEVGDEHHRHAGRPHPIDHLEQLVDLAASRLEVGSSRISTRASTSIARAIDTSCCTAIECDSSGDAGSMSRCSFSSTSVVRRRIAGQSMRPKRRRGSRPSIVFSATRQVGRRG